jgi:hypothetical protein
MDLVHAEQISSIVITCEETVVGEDGETTNVETEKKKSRAKADRTRSALNIGTTVDTITSGISDAVTGIAKGIVTPRGALDGIGESIDDAIDGILGDSGAVESEPDPVPVNDDVIVSLFTVRLPMPNQLNATYSQNWEDGDTSSLGVEVLKALNTVGAGLSDGTGVVGAIQKGVESIDNSRKVKTDVMVKKLKEAAIDTFLGEAATNFEQNRTKNIVNTKREMLYKGTDFRSFSFEFDIAPKSRREVVETMALIKGLKYWSAPANLGETIKFPAYFTINFFDRFGLEATNLGLKIGKSALTKLDVNFTPDGLWQTFTNGHPIHLKLTLEFKEIELMYRGTIAAGDLY